MDAANKVLRHEFDLLGSGPYTPVDPDRGADANGYQPIDWYLDPRIRSPFSARYSRIAQWNLDRMRPGRADIKLPWELSRCQHWPLLGQAYRLTRDERFAFEIANELHDFVEANPVGSAVNWACTMDVALRAANWALALELIRARRRPRARVLVARRIEALFDHGVFIEGHLENNYEVTSNHFLSDVVGLLSMWRGSSATCRSGQSGTGNAARGSTQEMKVQVLPDGADYESSVPYHRLVDGAVSRRRAARRLRAAGRCLRYDG